MGSISNDRTSGIVSMVIPSSYRSTSTFTTDSFVLGDEIFQPRETCCVVREASWDELSLSMDVKKDVLSSIIDLKG
jgi:hypothetical protein